VTVEERERMEILSGIEKANNLPNIHIPTVAN
jgi:hypothetical protein